MEEYGDAMHPLIYFMFIMDLIIRCRNIRDYHEIILIDHNGDELYHFMTRNDFLVFAEDKTDEKKTSLKALFTTTPIDYFVIKSHFITICLNLRRTSIAMATAF